MLEALRSLALEKKAHPLEAYLFLYQSLDRAQNLVGKQRHVSGQELLAGLRSLAIDQFGPLTLMVFEYWGLRQSQDVGQMVFHLVEAGLLGKTEDDQLEDFDAVYDFQEVFNPELLLAELKPRCQQPSIRPREGGPLGVRPRVKPD